MSNPVIITCVETGGIHTPTLSRCLPITPDGIAKAAIGAAEVNFREPKLEPGPGTASGNTADAVMV